MHFADPVQLVHLLLQIRELKPTTLAHIACKEKILQEAKKSTNWVEFSSSYYYTKLDLSFVGSFRFLSVPAYQSGYLKPFRRQEVMLICIRSGKRWTRGYIACSIDSSKLSEAETIFSEFIEKSRKPALPMQVICIDVRNPKTPHLLKPEHYISLGEIYTVHSTYQDKSDGHQYYYLVEKLQMIPMPSYRADRFISLDNIDELIMREQWQLEAYKQKMYAVKENNTYAEDEVQKAEMDKIEEINENHKTNDKGRWTNKGAGDRETQWPL